MRVRRFVVLGLFAASAVLPLACTGLLGDFSVSAGSGSTDGGGDVVAPSDATADADDGAPPFKPLTCKESKVEPRQPIAVLTNTNGNAPDRLGFFTHTVGGSSAATVLVPSGQSSDGGGYQDVLHAYGFPLQDSTPTVTDTPLMGYRLLSAVRYSTGLAALVFDYPNQQMSIFKLADGSNAWDSGHPVSVPAEIPSASCRLSGGLKPLSPGGDEYFVVATWVVGTNNCQTLNAPVLGAWHQKDGVVPVPMHPWGPVPGPDGGLPAGFDVGSQGILLDGPSVTVLVNASYAGANGGGPAPGVGPLAYHSSLQGVMSGAEMMKLKASDSFLYPMAAANSPTVGKADLSFLGGSLSSLGIYVGQVPVSQIPTFVAEKDLPATTIAKVGDLPVDKGTMHWESFAAPNASENFLAVSRGASGGANFYWFNERGQAIAQQAGATGLFQNDTVIGIDVGFVQTPISLFGQLEFVLVENTQGGGANDYSIWGVHVNCD
jgi:hypothetical protein